MLAAAPGAVVFRPSIMFGPEDDFFNRFARLALLSPALPLIGGGHTKFQPVYAGDVAEGIARLLMLPTHFWQALATRCRTSTSSAAMLRSAVSLPS